MYLMKEKQGGPIPTGLKHLADTTCISPSPAGPVGCCPLNFLYLVNLKFRVRAYTVMHCVSGQKCVVKQQRAWLVAGWVTQALEQGRLGGCAHAGYHQYNNGVGSV